MKTKQIKGKLDILLVDGLPEHKANEFKFGGMWLNMVRWKYISTIEGLSEEQEDGLVDEMPEHVTLQGKFYVDYTNEEMMFTTAIESFHSLLSANDVMFKNPYGDEPRSYSEVMDGVSSTELMENLQDWQEAQSKVLSPSTTLIFIKE